MIEAISEYAVSYQKREGGSWNKIDEFNVHSIASDAFDVACKSLDDGDIVILSKSYNLDSPSRIGFVISGEYSKIPKASTISGNDWGGATTLSFQFYRNNPKTNSVIHRLSCYWNIDRRKIAKELIQAIDYRFDSDLLKDVRSYTNGEVAEPTKLMEIENDSVYTDQAYSYFSSNLASGRSLSYAVSLINRLCLIDSNVSAGAIAGMLNRWYNYNNFLPSRERYISLGEYLFAGYKNRWKWRWLK